MAVQVLYGTDLQPSTTYEIILVNALLVMSAMVNANIFGQITVIISTISRKASRFQKQIEIANTAEYEVARRPPTQGARLHDVHLVQFR